MCQKSEKAIYLLQLFSSFLPHKPYLKRQSTSLVAPPLLLCSVLLAQSLLTNRKNHCATHPNPNHTVHTPTFHNSMQALHFIRALARISRPPPKSTTHSCRTKQIRRAAYASMAYTSGSRRTWSRTMLRRLQQQHQHRHRQQLSRRSTVRRRVRVVTPAALRPDEPTRAGTLRQLVPGGRSMDYCNLLEEAADYVQCLRAQVQLMQSLVDAFSSS